MAKQTMTGMEIQRRLSSIIESIRTLRSEIHDSSVRRLDCMTWELIQSLELSDNCFKAFKDLVPASVYDSYIEKRENDKDGYYVEGGCLRSFQVKMMEENDKRRDRQKSGHIYKI